MEKELVAFRGENNKKCCVKRIYCLNLHAQERPMSNIQLIHHELIITIQYD